LNLDVEIDSIVFDSMILDNTKVKIISDNDRILFKDLHFNFNESSVQSEIIYSSSSEKINGKAKLSNFIIEEKYFGKTKYDFLEGKIDCYFEFEMNKLINDFTKVISKSLVKGKCNSGKMKFKGIDLKNIANKIDDLDSLPKFFDLINQKNIQGFSIIESIDLTFLIKKGILYIDELKSIQDNVRISSTGNYHLISDRLNVKNEFFVRTEKYKNLPPFRINFIGNSNDYKVSYDLDEIRNILFADKINKILKKKKKIVISPGSIKGILKDLNIEKEIDHEKIIDLFLN
jgi:DNA polymerase III epsilon subunit-like protein